jgi:hypothetical protein
LFPTFVYARECYLTQCNHARAGVRDTWPYLHEIMNAYFRSHIENGLTGDLGERLNARSSVKLIQAVISASVCSDPRSTLFEDNSLHLYRMDQPHCCHPITSEPEHPSRLRHENTAFTGTLSTPHYSAPYPSQSYN